MTSVTGSGSKVRSLTRAGSTSWAMLVPGAASSRRARSTASGAASASAARTYAQKKVAVSSIGSAVYQPSRGTVWA
ncbi:hypothetical protein ABZS66_11040 [Dactylosporangium sp. NPDC005572]|uniref:hypothetical protein n=1 Tax=Dactylosporangium sp. NPDC005572 TaxID=3156889 RepID=UPI0033B19524